MWLDGPRENWQLWSYSHLPELLHGSLSVFASPDITGIGEFATFSLVQLFKTIQRLQNVRIHPQVPGKAGTTAKCNSTLPFLGLLPVHYLVMRRKNITHFMIYLLFMLPFDGKIRY